MKRGVSFGQANSSYDRTRSGARVRLGRRIEAQGSTLLECCYMREDTNIEEFSGRRENRQVQLEGRANLLFLLPFLLLGPALVDDFAERARMFAVEGFDNRLSEGGVAGIREQHSRPRDGLQQCPVQAQRQDQQNDHGTSGNAAHTRY